LRPPGIGQPDGDVRRHARDAHGPYGGHERAPREEREQGRPSGALDDRHAKHGQGVDQVFTRKRAAQRFALRYIVEDVIERPYITLGMTGLLLLIPLAITSTNGMMRRLGRRWQKLHRLAYVIAVLGVWHFYWQVKQDTLEPLIYAGVLALLFSVRVFYFLKRKRRERALLVARQIHQETA
jgi:hypothetical protein